MHCLYLGEQGPKTHTFQHLGLMANSGAILITASDWEIRQIFVYREVPRTLTFLWGVSHIPQA